MSGRRTATITITEEEYRRLHDLEMKRRFERDANDVEQDYRQRLDALNLQIKNLQGKLLAQKQEDAPDALALHQRLQIASRLIRALQQAGYRQVGYEFADHNRTTVLLRMERASDGSRATVAVGQDPDLVWAWYIDQSGNILPQHRALDNHPTNAIVVGGGNG